MLAMKSSMRVGASLMVLKERAFIAAPVIFVLFASPAIAAGLAFGYFNKRSIARHLNMVLREKQMISYGA